MGASVGDLLGSGNTGSRVSRNVVGGGVAGGNGGDVGRLGVVGSVDGVGPDFSLERLLRVVDDLSFDWDVLVSLDLSFLGDILDFFFGDVLRNVLPEVLDGIVVGDTDFAGDFFDPLLFSVLSDFSGPGDSFNSGFILVFDDLLLEGDVLDSALSLDHFLGGVHSGVHNLGLVLVHPAGSHLVGAIGNLVSVGVGSIGGASDSGGGVGVLGVLDGVSSQISSISG